MTAALPATAGPSGPFLPPTGVGPVPQAPDGADTAGFLRDLADQVGGSRSARDLAGAMADAIAHRFDLVEPVPCEVRHDLVGPRFVPADVRAMKKGAA